MCRGERIGNLFILGELIRIEVGISNLFIERGGMFMEVILCVIFFFMLEFLLFVLLYVLLYMIILSELIFVYLLIIVVLMII